MKNPHVSKLRELLRNLDQKLIVFVFGRDFSYDPVCVCVWVCVCDRMHVMHAITGCTG